MFDFEKCLEKYGFVVDFYSTESIAELMQIDESAEENENWYDDYFDSLVKFAKSKRLKKVVYGFGEHCEIFFTDDEENVINYILDNFYTAEGEGLTREEIVDNLTITEYNRIKELRTATKLSQQKFADLFGIPRRTYQDWEYGKSNCPDYYINLIEYYLKHENIIETAED